MSAVNHCRRNYTARDDQLISICEILNGFSVQFQAYIKHPSYSFTKYSVYADSIKRDFWNYEAHFPFNSPLQKKAFWKPFFHFNSPIHHFYMQEDQTDITFFFSIYSLHSFLPSRNLCPQILGGTHRQGQATGHGCGKVC